MLGNFECFHCLICDLLIRIDKTNLLNETFHESECQTVWIQIRPDILWGLIWIKKGLISKQPKEVTSRQRANTIVHTFAILKINFQITALKNKETLLIKQLNIKSGLYYFIPIGYQLFNFYTFLP